MRSCGVLKKGDRLSKILRMECSRIFTGLGGPWNEFQKVCRDYFKYSGSFAHSLSRLCLGTEAGGVFSSVCDRMDRGSDRESGGALF